MNDNFDAPTGLVGRDETPRASPSASPWITNPNVRGNAPLVISESAPSCGALDIRTPGAIDPARGPPLGSSIPCSASASNSTVPDVPFRLSSTRSGCVPRGWGRMSCSITSMRVKPRRRYRAIWEVGNDVDGLECAMASIPL